MKKYIIGAVFGFILSIGISAHAEVVSMIGKVVDGTFAVKVGDKALDTPAITIEGTSYLPVRAIGDAIGYDVGFDANGITMTKKQTVIPVAPNPIQPTIPNISPTTIKMIKLNNELKQNGDFSYIEIDGNQYVSLVVVDGKEYKVIFNNPNVIISKEGKQDVTINVRNEYQTNIDGFQYQGTSYVKLSALGLKVTASGDTLVIDK